MMTWGHLRSLLGSCWGVLVPFFGVLEESWRHLGTILGYFGGYWGGVGGVLEGVWVKYMDILDIILVRYDEIRVETIFCIFFCFFLQAHFL